MRQVGVFLPSLRLRDVNRPSIRHACPGGPPEQDVSTCGPGHPDTEGPRSNGATTPCPAPSEVEYGPPPQTSGDFPSEWKNRPSDLETAEASLEQWWTEARLKDRRSNIGTRLGLKLTVERES